MGEFYDIGVSGFEPRDGFLDMVQEVNRNSVKFPKVAFWTQDTVTGLINATKVRRVRRLWPISVVIKEDATGQEVLAQVVIYNRLGTPTSLEMSAFVDAAGNPLPLFDPNGRSSMEVPWGEVKGLAEAQAPWLP